MQYGYFDNEAREYVITRPDTPAPWVNYLGSPEYGAIISNQAGGYSFAKSGANGRILRYVFNHFDEPGRYLYIRDNESGDYWSASWMPVRKDLAVYESECRHGTGYTRMKARYAGILSEALYYVPLGKTHEVWALTLSNESERKRSLTASAYAEFTNHSNYEQDLVNLQYSLFISRTRFDGNRITQVIHGNLEGVEGERGEGDGVEHRFLGLAGAHVSSYCGSREAFLGAYRGYGDPAGIAEGRLSGEMNYNENSCGALSSELVLAPGESATLVFVAGAASPEDAERIIRAYDADPRGTTEAECGEIRAHFYGLFTNLQVRTGSQEFDTMINTWHAYNCFMTFIWSRAASLIYCGLRNGYGYRDTVQDIQGVIHLAPEMAKEKIRFMLTAQVDNGGGLPLVKFTHNAGHEDTPDDASYVKETGHPAYRADDALWLFPTVYKYIAETGDLAFLREVLPFANRDEGTVYEHLCRAVTFSKERLGPHGMPAGLHADWNDCLRLGKAGESTFVAFQYYLAMTILMEFAEHMGDEARIRELGADREKLGEILEGCFDGDRFVRGFTEDGRTIGSRDAKEADIWLNPQSWAVISGFAKGERAERILDTVHDRLNTEFGVMLMHPPYREHAFPGALGVIFNAGSKENAGIFSQTQGWIILAEALLGRGGRAYTYYLENSPAAQNGIAERRRIEPYCYGQFTEGRDSAYFGRSHVHWLTGTASTMMVAAVEGILGIRPDLGGLRLSPAFPGSWDHVEIEKVFRGKKLHIAVENPGHVESGFVSLLVNGNAMESGYIPAEVLLPENNIVLTMS